MNLNRLFTAFLMGVSVLVIVSSCKNDPKPNASDDTTVQSTPVTIPSFNHDSAYAYVAKQVAFGPRVPNSAAHTACKDWFVATFKAHGLTVIEQNFTATAYDGKVLKSTNIIGQYKPEHKKRIVLAAHWDSRPFADSELSTERRNEPILGADDGASGVGVLLELSRLLKEHPMDMGIDFVLFDAEDYGKDSEEGDDPEKNMYTWALGSQHWSKNLHVAGYSPKYGILLDMVGAKNAYFTKEGFSMQVAPGLVNNIWKLAGQMGYGNFFPNQEGGPVTDDHFFVIKNANIAMIDIIFKDSSSPTGFGAHWHTHNDDMNVIDTKTLKAIGRVMTAVIYKESAGQF